MFFCPGQRVINDEYGYVEQIRRAFMQNSSSSNQKDRNSVDNSETDDDMRSHSAEANKTRSS